MIANATGIEFTPESGAPRLVRWPEIVKITVFKQDCHIHDLVCVEIDAEWPTLDLLLTEETKGFKEFLPALNHAFPVIDANWYQRVCQPPFATNMMVLYSRPVGDARGA